MPTFKEAAFYVENGVTYYFKDTKAREQLKECFSPSNPPPAPSGVLPPGGTTGQIPKKRSNADYDVEWGDADARNIWYATCSTATGTAAKEATSSSGNFTLTTGAMVRVKFTNTNNQPNATLSVDGSTAKAIKNLPSDSNVNTQWWRAGEVIDMVYDGTDFIMSDGGMASASYYGKTILSNSTSSSSQTTAATSKAVKDTYDAIPTNVSQLTNDSGYITSAQAPVQSVNNLTGAVTIPTVAIQDTTPTGGELLWVDTDEPGTSISLPEIDDSTTSSVDTWSSQKIAGEFASAFAFVQMTTSNTSYTVVRPSWASKFLIMKTQGSNYYETKFAFTGGATTSLGKNTNLVAMARSGITSDLFLTGVDDYSGNGNTIVVIWG